MTIADHLRPGTSVLVPALHTTVYAAAQYYWEWQQQRPLAGQEADAVQATLREAGLPFDLPFWPHAAQLRRALPALFPFYEA